MRRSSSTTNKWGASSGGAAGAVVAPRIAALNSAARPARSIGARDEAEHGVAVFDVDHGGQKSAGGLVCVRTELGERARNTRGLQAGELHRQGLAFCRHVEQALPPVIGALLLHHVALIDELLEYAADRLLGDLEDIQEFRNLHAGITVDEMQHPMVRAPEAQLRQHVVGIADEVPIGEEQKLDEIPYRFVVAAGSLGVGKRASGCDGTR